VAALEVGDIVLASVAGTAHLHLVSAVNAIAPSVMTLMREASRQLGQGAALRPVALTQALERWAGLRTVGPAQPRPFE
jgi:hypothetical protein